MLNGVAFAARDLEELLLSARLLRHAGLKVRGNQYERLWEIW